MDWAHVVLKTAHIVAVVIAFGTLLGLPVLRRMMLGRGSDASAELTGRWYATSLAIRRWVGEPTFGLVGVLGIALAVNDPNGEIFSLLWIKLAIGLFVCAYLVVLFLQGPLARRCVRLHDQLTRDPTNAEAAKALRFSVWALEMLTVVSALGLVAMVVLMITKPGA